MKLTLTPDLLSTLISSAQKKQTVPKQTSPKARADELEAAAVLALAKWGHLRCSDLARVLWRDAAYPEQLAQRLVRKLERRGLVMTRVNTVGTRSFVLTRPGAALGQALGTEARHGLDLASVSGGTFPHRCLATRYGIERELEGATCLGEHSMASTSGAFNRAKLKTLLGKLPDLVAIDNESLDWIEVESAPKATSEIERCLAVARYCGNRFPHTNTVLRRLVFVCDGRLNHINRITRTAKKLWENFTPTERQSLASRVYFVEVTLGPCAKWESQSPLMQMKL